MRRKVMAEEYSNYRKKDRKIGIGLSIPIRHL
jgi:hypothetical protein